MMRRTGRALVAAVLAVAALAACSTSASTPTTTSGAASVPVAQPTETLDGGTGGQLIPIQSDNVTQAGYDTATATMTVLFDSGGLYEYYDVPGGLWEAFVAAQPHPWSAVGYPQLVKGGYGYSRIG